MYQSRSLRATKFWLALFHLALPTLLASFTEFSLHSYQLFNRSKATLRSKHPDPSSKHPFALSPLPPPRPQSALTEIQEPFTWILHHQKRKAGFCLRAPKTRNQRWSISLVLVSAHGLLEWHGEVRLGSLNKSYRKAFQDESSKEGFWDELLQQLNTMGGYTYNKCPACSAVPGGAEECRCLPEEERVMPFEGLDPRSNPTYNELSTLEKCKNMTAFIATLVSNFQANFNYEHITDAAYLPSVFRNVYIHISMPFRYLKAAKPKRYAFAVNIVAVEMAYSELVRRGSLCHFLDPFLGNGFADTLSLSFRVSRHRALMAMLPGDDETIEKFLRQKSPLDDRTRHLLGPVLVDKLDLFAPFFKDNKIILPPDLEQLTPEELARNERPRARYSISAPLVRTPWYGTD